MVRKVTVDSVYTNHDYEPYASQPEINNVKEVLTRLWQSHLFHLQRAKLDWKEMKLLKHDGTPYTVFTPLQKQMALTF